MIRCYLEPVALRFWILFKLQSKLLGLTIKKIPCYYYYYGLFRHQINVILSLYISLLLQIPSYMRLAQSHHARGLIDDAEFEERKQNCSDFAKDLVTCFKYEFL